MTVTTMTGDNGATVGERQPVRSQRVVIVGQGYVGLPVAVAAVDAGHMVVGYDVDKRKISGLVTGRSHIDDIDDDRLARVLATGRYIPTADERDLSGFDVAVITVPTPLLDGVPDITFIESAATTVGRYLNPGALVILESTTYPGTTDEIVASILEAESGLRPGHEFHLGYSPERIDPGNATWTFERTPKVVSGIDDESLARVKGFYDDLVDETVPVAGTREAELTKLLENTFRHVNIALVNELAVHAKQLDIDLWSVIDAATTKPFGFMPFYPGPGVGGHCLPVDPAYLSWQFERRLGSVSRFVKVANSINDSMPGYVVQRVQAGLNDRLKPVKGSRILVLGLAYKRNSNDARMTPASGVINGLLRLGAEVRVHDNHVGEFELDDVAPRVALTAEELESADAVVVLADHDDIDYQLVLDRADYVFDTRRRLAGTGAEQL